MDSSDIEQRFFNKYTPELGTAPALTVPEELQKVQPIHPMRHALPTEEEIGKMVDGSHPSSGGTAVTRRELYKKFDILRKNKHGLHEKIREVLARKCTEEEDKTTGEKWLKWIR